MRIDPLRPASVQVLRRVVGLALAAIIASGAVGATTAAATRQVALGISRQPDDFKPETYRAARNRTGRWPAIWSIWSDWGGKTRYLPDTGLMADLKSHGTVPLVIWSPVDPAHPRSGKFTYKRIARGDDDWYIKRFAREVNAYHGRVLIRFAHEFDGDWFPWGILGKNRLAGNDPASFKKAWAHVWNIFRGHGKDRGLARNARFIWSPLGCDCNQRMDSLWPGGTYVDYLGLTAFNWAAYHKVHWVSLVSIVSRRMRGFADLPKKPVILTEVGSHYRGGDKARWIRDGYAAIYQRYPRIRAIMYFDVDMNQVLGDPDHPEDWLLTKPDDHSALRAYRDLAQQHRFKGRIV
jgi:hypothetical protein